MPTSKWSEQSGFDGFFKSKQRGIDKEILTWTYRKDEDDTGRPRTLELDTILRADDDVSHWRERHQLWYARR